MINFIKRILGIHVHEWGKWEVFAQGSISTTYDGKEITTGHFNRQRRTCSLCGYTQIKTETC